MKKFKHYIKESAGSVSHLLWHFGQVTGSAVLMVDKKEFDKDQDAATMKVLKQRVPQAKALTKLSREKNPITFTSGTKSTSHYLVRVDFTTKGLKEAVEGQPTAAQKTKEKHEREKEDLKRKHEREQETARTKDFKDKENKRKQEIAKRDAEKRTRDSLKEYLEDGTDELVSTYKKDVPGQ